MDLNQRAIDSAVPPNIDTVTAYGRPTPVARTLVGKSSAFTTALIDVYPATMTHAAAIRRNAPSALVVACSERSSGTVNIVPIKPNQISSGLRPILSESAP